MTNKSEHGEGTHRPGVPQSNLESRFARLRRAAPEREATEVIQLPLWP
jgi:hypothetical protein